VRILYSVYYFTLSVFLMIQLGCSEKFIIVKPDPGEQFYLAHNFWVDNRRIDTYNPNIGRQIQTKLISIKGKDIKLASLNYKIGVLIPIGSIVENLEIGSSELKFIVKDINSRVTYKVVKRYEPLVTGQDLFERSITTKTFESITEGISFRFKEAIKSGMVLKGMSKSNVLLAFGYPPAHQTPSLDLDTWIYWHTKSKRILVEFDADGKVKENVIP